MLGVGANRLQSIGVEIGVGLFLELQAHVDFSTHSILASFLLQREPLLHGLQHGDHHVCGLHLEPAHEIFSNEIVVPHFSSDHRSLCASVPVVGLVPFWVEVLFHDLTFGLLVSIDRPLDKRV